MRSSGLNQLRGYWVLAPLKTYQESKTVVTNGEPMMCWHGCVVFISAASLFTSLDLAHEGNDAERLGGSWASISKTQDEKEDTTLPRNGKGEREFASDTRQLLPRPGLHSKSGVNTN